MRFISGDFWPASGPTFASAFHVVRTIGLSFVDGSGVAGELTALSGNGFSAGVLAPNSVVINAEQTVAGKKLMTKVPAIGDPPAVKRVPYNIAGGAFQVPVYS